MAYIQDKAKRWLAEAGADKLGGMIREGKQANLALVAAIAACDVADGVIGGLSDVYQPKGTKTVSTETLHETAKRMCDKYDDCDGCPLDGVDGYCAVGPYAELTDAQVEAQFVVLRKWAAENPPKPVKTYREDFYEKFPDAKRRESGYPLDGIWCFYKAKYVNRFDGMTFEAAWDKPLGYWES